jgi:GT2 family glycosyltransferase
MNRFANSLVIIIVIYNRALKACESFQSILEMAKNHNKLQVFVYDNSPTAQEIKSYENVEITYFNDPKNSGVSKAYNVGVAHAKANNKEFVLLLDQDTQLPNTILNEYFESINKHQEVNMFVPILRLKNGKIFSPSRYRFKRGFFVDNMEPGIHSLFNLAPVNSGMLVNVNAFLKVGGYNEKVKLDFADFQFVERFRKAYAEFYVINVECEQDFSDDNVSLERQQMRFKFYCEGAKNVENKSITDNLQYSIVVLMRALRLSMRFSTISFIGYYFKHYLFTTKG